jgi:hypothetical protein
MKTILYTLSKSKLPGNEGKYTGRVVNNTTITEAQIIAEMVRTGTVASETDIVAVMNLYKQTVVYFVSLGYRVDTALAIFNCSI